ERRLALVVRIGITVAIITAVAVAAYYGWVRRSERTLRQEARILEDKSRLYKKIADTESQAREAAEKQLYIRNIAAAQSRWLNNDVQKARESLRLCAPELRHWE